MGKFDGIFDDVIVNAKAAASAVSKKAGDVYDSSKLKISAAEIRGEITSKLRDLGALTYKSKVQNVDLSDKIDEKISEIIDLKDNLNALNEQIAVSKNQKNCPECGSYVPKNSLFCNICGAKIDESKDDAFDDFEA